MLQHMKLHHRLWAEAMAIAKYMQNQIPINGIFYKSNFVCFWLCCICSHAKENKDKVGFQRCQMHIHWLL
jgi:hypothetical protein